MILFGILSLVVVMVGCVSQERKKFDYGSIEDNKYINTYFKFEMDLPSDWTIQSNENYEKNKEKAKNILAKDDKELKDVLNVTDISTANLLNLLKFGNGDTFDFNPNILLSAKNLQYFPRIKTGKDDLQETVNFLKKSNLSSSNILIIDIDEEFEKQTISNQEFYVMNATFNNNGKIIKQTVYSRVQNGFSLGAVLSYTNNKHRSELENILKSIKFYE